jgi:penicillin-binding protein 2
MNQERRYIIQGIFIAVGLIFMIRLFMLQVLDKDYRAKADSNVIQRVDEFPYRGLIYDRNNELLVINNPIFDLMVVPFEMRQMDTTAFIDLLKIDKATFITKMEEATKYSRVKPSVFMKQISMEDFARIQDYLVDFPGFFINARSVRSYPHTVMAHVLGYLAEIDAPQLERDTTKYYKKADYIGKSGLEYSYEQILRGRRGVKYKLVNVRGVEKGAFKEGEFDTLPLPGENIYTTIDLELQEYAERLMQGKIGSVVAIEPATGEILTMVSAPTYDPNLLTGREFGNNFMRLTTDPDRPLFNRPIMADVYPPGSIFKMFQALVAMQEGVINPLTRIPCNRGIIACHGSHSYEDLSGAIKYSCNPYFHQVFRLIVNQNVSSNTFKDTEIGLEKWREHMLSFGLGQPLGVDLPNEKSGRLPGANLYNRIYGEGRWRFSTIYSLSIGQGELGISPLQMANLTAILANRGYFYTPHLIKRLDNGDPLPEKYTTRRYTTVDEKHFEPVIGAMSRVINEDGGTGFRARLKDIEVVGKTGTSQNPRGEDHSVFIAFAPRENPQIAVAVYVENAGQGARAAASVAGLVIEKYLKREIQRKNIEDFALANRFIF